MAENPYAPIPEDTVPDESDKELLLPEYLGTLKTISGHIDKEQALTMLAGCRKIEINTNNPPTPTNKWTWWVILLTLMFAFMALTTTASNPTPTPTSQTTLDVSRLELVVFWIVAAGIPIGSVIAFVLYALKYRVKIEDFDPPIWGHTRIDLHKEWFQIDKECADGREVQIRFAWRDTLVTAESEEAWQLHGGHATPILIPKSWLQETSSSVLDGFFNQLTKWRWHQPDGNIPAIETSESAQALPDLPSDGIAFSMNSREEKTKRHLLKKQLCNRFPNLRIHDLITHEAPVWIGLGVILSLGTLGYVLYMICFGTGAKTWMVLSCMPAVFLGILSFLVGRSISKPRIVEGRVLADSIWFDHGTLQSRFMFRSMGIRIVIDDALALASKTGEDIFVIPKSAFKSDEEWQRAIDMTGATPS